MSAVTSNSPARPAGRVGRAVRGPVPGLLHERHWWDQGATVAGVDEVGRGAWAGPVTYAAVVLSRNRRVYKLRDSKLLSPTDREGLAARIADVALGIGLGQSSNDEIDRLGMSAAIRLAARRAVDALPVRPDALLIDGSWDFLSDYGTTNERLVRGDGRSASIAAASIVAKVHRDRQMVELHTAYGAFSFASNKGYPAPVHLAALERFGPCPIHRRSWAPLRQADTPRLPGMEHGTWGSSGGTSGIPKAFTQRD